MSYWIIKSLLLAGLCLVAVVMLRPIRSSTYLAIRRLGVIAIVLAAAVGVLFPELVASAARLIGVDKGVNLLVYFLFLVVLTQMANSYRTEKAMEEKITRLTRALALIEATEREQGADWRPGQAETEKTGDRGVAEHPKPRTDEV